MDILPMQERLLKNHSLAMEQSVMPTAMDDLLRKVSVLVGYMADFNIENSVCALQNCVRFTSELLSEQSIQSLGAKLEMMAETMTKIQSVFTSIYESPLIPTLNQTLENLLARALELSTPYIPDELKTECDTVISKKLNISKKKRLSLSDLITIVSVLVTIYFGIISSLPNEQLDRIVDIDKQVVAQQSKIIESHTHEDLKLYEALDALTDSIDLLSDEINTLRDQIQSMDNVTDGKNQSTNDTSQTQNSNTKD